MITKTSQTRVLFGRCLSRARLAVFVLFSFSIVATVIVSVSYPTPVQAATNTQLNFQARLQSNAGATVPDGFYNVQFKVYSVLTAGTALWTESHIDTDGVTPGNDFRLRVKNGYLTVSLGSQTAFPTTINWDQDLYITMNIGGTTQTATPTYDGEMSPRLRLTGVPYAFRAGQLATGNGTLQSTLQILQPTVGNQTFQIQDQAAAGTYNLCIQNSTACGFAAASGSASYIQNGTTPQATSNFNISGNGTIGGNLNINGNANLIQPTTDSTAALQIRQSVAAGGAVVFNADTTNGRVGIGTAIPNNVLHVHQANGAGDVAIQIQNNATTAGETASLVLTTTTSNTTQSARIQTERVDANNNRLFFANRQTGVLTTSLAIDETGKVGIGIAAPAYKLDVVGDINTSTGYRAGGTAGAAIACVGGQLLQNATTVGGIVTAGSCVAAGGGGGGITTVGVIDSQAKSANGAVIVGATIYQQTADASNPGLVSTGAQTLAGAKTFNGHISGIAGATISGATSNINHSSNFSVNIGTGTSTGVISIGGGSGSFALDTLTLDISAAGAISGATTIATSGAINGQTISTAASLTGSLAVAGAVTLNGATTIGDAATDRLTVTSQLLGASPLAFQGLTDNLFTTTIAVTDPTANNILTLPNYSGTVVASSNTGTTGECLKSNGASAASSYGTCGTASTLQDVYNASGTANPQILLSTVNGGIKIRDNVTPVSGNLFQLQNSGGTVTHFGASTAGISVQYSTGASALAFTTSDGRLRIYNPSNAAKFADIYYDNAADEAVYSSSGTTRVGNGNGNVTLKLGYASASAASDVFAADKTLSSLAAAYSLNDFTFTRNITAGSTSLTGSVVSIESLSSSVGANAASTILRLNENNTAATGNLIVATKGGTGFERFKVDTGGTVTVAAGQSYTSLGAVSYTGVGAVTVNSGAGTALTMTGNAASVLSTTAGALTLTGAAGLNITGGTGNITIGTSDATGTLLVLDTKNDNATDPTGINGGMYYNSVAGAFRCYENGIWYNCISRHTVTLGADVINNNAVANTAADVTGLSFNVTAGTTYRFRAVVAYNVAATTTGARWSINGPATSLLHYTSNYTLTATTMTTNYASAYNIPALSNATSLTTGNVAQVEGVITPSASGTVMLRFASEVASSAVTAKAGSVLEWW